MKIMPVYCIPDGKKDQRAAVEKIEAKKEPEISFGEILKAEEKRLEHQA